MVNFRGIPLNLTDLGSISRLMAIGGTDITRGRPDFLTLFDQAAQNGGT